jgi:two-component system sensor histidine kinase KdpD
VSRIPDEERRPSPEALLQVATQEHRSRLKIFVGAAPGVGKTFAMLQAAHERRQEGADVVVGVVETHGRRETEALLQGLEVVPRQVIDYKGTCLQEMDVDAILARRAELVLVDELAHTNAPGSRHPKRFSDVEEILAAGIDVYTTVNIQHLESLNDVVAQITGIRVRETVPDRFFERADELKLIDVTPEDLLERLREGKVYLPAAAERAIRNYFRPGNLTALRELALRHTAERVDDQMRTYMQAHGVPGVWAVAERILVCVSGGRLSERLIRAARRLADRRHAEWLAVFVETAAFHRLPDAERSRVARVMRLAEQLGGEAVTIPGERVADEIIRYAERRNVTELILGKSHRSGWREWWSGSPLNEVIRKSGDIDVRVITGERTPGVPEPQERPRARPAVNAHEYLIGLAFVGLAGVAAQVLRKLVSLHDPGMVFLTAILFTALRCGLGPSIAASAASLLVYDFFFVDPLYTLSVAKRQDLLSLLAFLVVAVLTSNLMTRVRDQADAARRRAALTEALYAFSRELAAAVGIDDLLPKIVQHVAEQFRAHVAVLLPAGGRLVTRAAHPAGTDIGPRELAEATWVWEHNQAAGRGTDTLPGGEWFHTPLHTARGVVGVLALRVPGTGGVLPVDQRQLLEALARQAAIAIERTRVDVVLEQQAKTEAVIEAIEDGLIVLDPAGVVVHANEVACAILEIERSEVLGRRFDDLGTGHRHYLRLRAAVGEFLTHPERQGEHVELAMFLRGRDHYYVLRPTPYHALDGSYAGLIVTLQDVTYLRDQEARRQQLAATLSHGVATSLISQHAALGLLDRHHVPLDDEERRLVEGAREDITSLQEVAERFLGSAGSRIASIKLENGRVDLRELVSQVVKLFGSQVREKQATLEMRMVDADLTVVGDRTKLGWVVSNLLANALRYTPRGGRVEVAVTPDPHAVRVSVTDTGPGIPPDQRDRLFDPVEQSGAGGELGAAGLGLAVVRDIVQAHGGRITLESRLGRGSSFTVTLPRP